MTEGMDQKKVALFGHLLKEAFAGDMVDDAEDFGGDCWLYRVRVASGTSMRHRVRVTREFLDDNDEAAIRNKFHDWNLADVIRRAGVRSVLITPTGPEVAGGEER
jgi:hypothetical protein